MGGKTKSRWIRMETQNRYKRAMDDYATYGKICLSKIYRRRMGRSSFWKQWKDGKIPLQKSNTALPVGNNYENFLCGVTQNQVDNIDKLTSNVWEHVDGLIFVDGGSTDGTKELLEDRVGQGEIVYRNWTNDHDLQMSEILRQGPMEIGDWFILRDSMERFNDDFAKSIVSLTNARNQNIKSIYSHGKGFAFEYYDDMFFLGSPTLGFTKCKT